MGNTALDILAQSHRGFEDYDIGNCLKDAIDLKAVEHDQAIPFSPTRSNPQMPWLVEKRNILMVVASVLATMAFQVGISPPGGVWKEDSIIDIPNPYRAGEAVVAYNYQETYEFYLLANTIVTKIQDRGQLRRKMYIAVSVWCGLSALLLFRHTIRLIVNTVREKRSGNKDIKRSFKFASGKPSRREPIAPPNLVDTSQADICFSCSRCEFH